MAKKIISWKFDGSILKVGLALTKEEQEDGQLVEYTEEFDLDEILEIQVNPEIATADNGEVILLTYKDLNNVQRHLFEYGIKQKLADAGSQETLKAHLGDRQKAFDASMECARAKWGLFVKGELTGERSNSTGAKENKILATNIREAAQAVSLEGLIAKKMMNPQNFSKEDQAKLDEFIKIQAEHLARQ